MECRDKDTDIHQVVGVSENKQCSSVLKDPVLARPILGTKIDDTSVFAAMILALVFNLS